ncbi:DUF6816 family protein [Prochlorococcus sp. MIT 1223]|uniref:DUF6816 family protein n=1 Tax=Prochlorococcus sp. MIT 1223 TaxID=3096217 RepID=UPI002A750637|nr:POLO box duplicated region [Prochlorococcus sp. MIT 1223]
MIPDQALCGDIGLYNSFDDDLAERQLSWPLWALPGPFRRPQDDEDLIYPEYFLGDWQIINFDLSDPKKKFVIHKAKFRHDSNGKVVADRAFNTKSLGQEIFGSTLIDVIDDPDSPNRQLALFQDDESLETKVIGRSQSSLSNGLFISDELALQIFHSLSISRINQVETLGRYSKCRDQGILLENINSSSICGEQWQGTYKAPGESLKLKSINSNHFKLLFISATEQLPSKKSLVDLANQKDQLILDGP